MASKPKMPPPQPPARMPVPNDPAQAEAKRRAQNALMGTRGRESTDLTGGMDVSTSFLGK